MCLFLFVRLIAVIAVASVFLFAPRGWNRVIGVGIHQFQRTAPEAESLELDGLSFQALDQRYIYKTKGRQSYVFFSEDNRFVLKIPRKDKLCKPKLSTIGQIEQSEKSVMPSLRRTRERLMDETGGLCIHLGEKIREIPSGFRLCDRMGRPFKISLDSVVFVLQRKMEYLESAIRRSSFSDAQELLSGFLELIERETKKGLICKDFSGPQRNFGCEGKKVFRIDIGTYYPFDAAFSWNDISDPMLRWLKKENNPDLCQWFQDEIAKKAPLSRFEP